MKIKLLFTSLLFVGCMAKAQFFQAKDILVTIGVNSGGIAPADAEIQDVITGDFLISGTNLTRDNETNPFSLSLTGQYFINELFSVGGYLSFSTANADVAGTYSGTNGIMTDYDLDGDVDDRLTRRLTENRLRNAFFYGIKGEFHAVHLLPSLPEKLDLYAGIGLGAYSQWEKVSESQTIEFAEIDVNTVADNNTTQITPHDDYAWRPDGGTTGSVFLGARYFFTDKIGAGIEASLFNSYVEIHLGIKL